MKGFSLIELMIVVVIVAILAAIAVPAYNDSVNKARRSDAQSALLGFAQAMERWNTNRNTYIGAGDTDVGTDVDAIGEPSVFPTQAPLDGATKFYNLRITAATATAYTLQAQPIGAMAGDGIFQITNTGLKSWDKNNDGDFVDTDESCWNISAC